MQVAVQLVEPRPYRHPLPKGRQRAANLTGVRVDEDGSRVIGRDVVDRQRHLGGLVRRRWWANALDRALGMGRAHCGQLLCQRQALLTDVIDGQLVAVHHVIDLRNQRVQQARDRRYQDERADEDAGVEVQPHHQRPEAARSLPRRCAWSGSGRVVGRILKLVIGCRRHDRQEPPGLG
jgi:hypothetical protein